MGHEEKQAQSAGEVVLNPNGEVLIVSQRGDSWSFPKGHIDEDEDAETVAHRETREESGIKCLELVKELGSYERCKIGKGGVGEDCSEQKRITMFLFRTDEYELTPEDAHNPEARWVLKEDVAGILTHPKDKAFFRSVITSIS